MKLRQQAKETLSDVTSASKAVVESTSWATVALVCVSVVSVVALGVATAALMGSRQYANRI